MKATGIVRRIDDLGRIVIPKEIRRTLRIREGDPLEIFTNREEEIMLKKYSPIGELGEFAQVYAESIFQATGLLVAITDRDVVIAQAGPQKKVIEKKMVSQELDRLMEGRKIAIGEPGSAPLYLIEGDETLNGALVAVPILCNGDCIGAVIMYQKEQGAFDAETAKYLAMTSAQFLGRHME